MKSFDGQSESAKDLARGARVRFGCGSLLLVAGDTAADDAIEASGHEPNGYFWEGVATWLARNEAPELEGRYELDPEAGTFCARGTDREALERLGALLAGVANDPDRLRQLLSAAASAGFDFDD